MHNPGERPTHDEDQKKIKETFRKALKNENILDEITAEVAKDS
jgi:hypothetical protein